MPKSSRRRHRPQGTNARRNLLVAPSRIPVVRRVPPELSRIARMRLEMLDWHERHGRNVSRTARHFGYSRPTVYRWRARFERGRLESLEDRSSRPVRRRRPTWTLAQLTAIRRLRERYPRWGKDKLAVLLGREGIRLSVSMVGRILRRLRASGELREPAHRGLSVQGRRWVRPHAVRTPRGHVAERPGDLVELDTLDIRFPGLILKQFTARDVVSRWDVLVLAPSAAARNAVTALEAVLDRMPFPVRALSVDNGSEFMAGFEAACAERQIPLYLLPPRSPKLHARVERANRTHTEEFHEVTAAEPDLVHLAPALRAWENTYNRVRPHQSLGYLTPAEYLASLGIDV